MSQPRFDPTSDRLIGIKPAVFVNHTTVGAASVTKKKYIIRFVVLFWLTGDSALSCSLVIITGKLNQTNLEESYRFHLNLFRY